MMNRSSGLSVSRLALGVLCALACAQASAMGLGPIEVRSGLNQPLVAEIPILSEGEDIEALKAQLANPADLKRVGIDASTMSVQLYFDVGENSQGRPVIRVTSYDPVREPYLSFLVEANWGKGRLLREYSVLLDPPVFAPAVIERAPAVAALPPRPIAPPVSTTPAVAAPAPTPPAAVVTPAPAPPTPARPTPAPAPAMPSTPPAAESADTAPASPPPAATRSDTYTVQEGDALYRIAAQQRPDDSVSINQMMVAMLRANPSAFYKDNINALKKGAVLRIPDAEDARALGNAAAAAEVASQVRAWSGADEPTLVADAGSERAPSAPASKPAAAASVPPPKSDRLALVPPKAGTTSQVGTTRAGTAGGTGAAQAAELRADLARTREQLASREQEAVELRSRVKDLEKIGGESQRLIELRSSEIAALNAQIAETKKRLETAQQNAATARAAALRTDTVAAAATATAAAAAAAADAAKVDAPVATAAGPGSVAVDPVATVAADAAAPDGAAAAAGAKGDAISAPGLESAIDPLSGTALAADADAVAEAASGESGIDANSDAGTEMETAPAIVPLDATTTAAAGDRASARSDAAADDATAGGVEPVPAQPWYRNTLYLGIGAVILAVLGLLALFGRRRPPVVNDITDLERPSVANQFESGVLPMGAAGDSDSGYPRDSTLVAPVMGDEVLERALLDRRDGDPDNLEHHLDVLRHYHETNDRDRFVEAASSMRGHVVEAEHYAWQEAQELGRDIDPSHPLFSTYGSDVVDSYDEPAGFRQASSEPPTPVAWQPAVTSAAQPADLADEDWDQPRSAPVAVSSFDSDEFDVDKPEVDAPVLEDSELTHYQFDELPAAPHAASSPALGEDAVATKLDLARAYIDMGDSDGASAMLQEVLGEGSSTQREEAQRLIDGLT